MEGLIVLRLGFGRDISIINCSTLRALHFSWKVFDWCYFFDLDVVNICIS